MMPRRAWLFLALALVASARHASAYCRTMTVPTSPTFQPQGDSCWDKGIPVFWKERCVGYGVQEGGSASLPEATISAVAGQAFTAWTQAACARTTPTISATLGPAVPVRCTKVGYVKGAKNNVNEIIVHDGGWPYNDGVNTLALTTLTFNADTGQILDADIELNTRSNQLTTEVPVPSGSFDLQSILTHEAGHFLGLGHSGATEAVMYSMYKAQSISMRKLAKDDVEGICAVYAGLERPTGSGPVSSTECSTPPRGTFDGSCPGQSKGGGCSITSEPSASLFVALGIGAWLAARARRAKRRSARR